jgi:hypothetical protein
MNVPDRRGLNLGIALTAIGVFFLVRRELHLTGPGPILLLIGTVLFTISALRDFRGPVVPAGVLIGLGIGFLLRDPLEPWMPPWATLLAFLGGGLLLAAAVDRYAGRGRRPSTLVPGLVLVAIAAATAISRNVDLPENLFLLAWKIWPWALVGAGVLLVVQGMRGRRST